MRLLEQSWLTPGVTQAILDPSAQLLQARERHVSGELYPTGS